MKARMNSEMIDPASVRLWIMYPADPLGAIAGGIDTFIRGIVRYAPPWLEISVVGATTAHKDRPIGEWTICKLGSTTFNFLPLVKLPESGRRPTIPVSLRYTLALAARRSEIEADVLEFHVIEPSLALLQDNRPKTVVIHQNMSVLRAKDSDIRWRHLPWLYFRLEQFLLPRMNSIFCVRSDAIRDYQDRYPEIADRFKFTPTYVDSDVFFPPSSEERQQSRYSLCEEFGFAHDDPIFVTVGRLSGQKNPQLMVDAFMALSKSNSNARLLFVGDGNLRQAVDALIAKYDLENRILVAGIRGSDKVATYLKGADVFVLSSGYEGMPMCVLEALACGLPVASTDVGEVARVVSPGVNGELVSVHEPEQLAHAMEKCLRNVEKYRGEPCTDAIQDFLPEKVLKPIYENYRKLAAKGKT